MPAKTDTSRNAVIGLAEMVENKARQFAPGIPGRDFYMDVADTLRALVDESEDRDLLVKMATSRDQHE